MTASERAGRSVAAFTSVGAITVSLQVALDCRIARPSISAGGCATASITDYVFSRDRLTLDGFNALPHLDESNLWTFR